MKGSNSSTFLQIPVEQIFFNLTPPNPSLCMMNSLLFYYVKDNTSWSISLSSFFLFFFFPFSTQTCFTKQKTYHLKRIFSSYNLASLEMTIFTLFLILNLLKRGLYVQCSYSLLQLPPILFSQLSAIWFLFFQLHWQSSH